jgi:5-enolpyruvylshikimate-3-phosphate synthase
MRLLAGLLAGQTFESRLVADAGLSKRPMERVIAPLRQMGANIVAEGPDETPPLRIQGGSLRGIRYRQPVASAQVKGALLLGGLFAKGKTTVIEPVPTRNHLELMFDYFLVRIAVDEMAASLCSATRSQSPATSPFQATSLPRPFGWLPLRRNDEVICSFAILA